MKLLLFAGVLAGLSAAPAWSEDAPQPARPELAPEQAPPTPAANLAALQPCGARAARYAGPKGFDVVVTRIGRTSVDNPLRPLTPEVTEVLQVVIGGKSATAYGPDLTALRRGAAPAALESQLGAPIRWEAALQALPDPLAIVAEDGTPLASLAFRDCVDPPAVVAPPVVARGTKGNGKDRRKGNAKEAGAADGAADANGAGKETPPEATRRPAKPAPRKDAAPKAPPGFHVPQGAIAE